MSKIAEISNNNEIPENEKLKLDQLYNIYVSAFDIFKKSKKDQKHQKIKEIITELKASKDNFHTFHRIQIQKYSMEFVAPLEKCNTESMETILTSMEEILKKNLVDTGILQNMVERLITYIPVYLRNNEIDYKVNAKILYILELMYAYPGIFVHNENLKTIIKIYLRIYLSMSNVEMFQSHTQKTLSVLISRMIEQMKECNITNKSCLSNVNEINIDQNTEIDKKKKLLYKLQLNEFNYISNKYLDYLIDLIEIQTAINNNENDENKIDILNTYINIIKNMDYTNPENDSIRTELEKLNLSSLNIYYNNEENNKLYKIGKYGWCILCRKKANFWSNILQFPICSEKNCFCEIEFNNCLNNVYPRNDFLNMLIYLSITSTVGTEDEYSNATKEMNFLCRQFCLENIKEMIEKSYNLFKNDSDVILIIKEIFRDSLLKNTLSSNIKIFQPSLELFITIIKAYRIHLKEQIEIFFMRVLITFLESENLEFVFKDAVLKALLQLVNDCSFLVEIYVNYDCDVNCTAVFSELINILTKIMNGLYHKSKYQNTFKPLQENELINKTLDFLNKFVFNLNALVEKNERKNLGINNINNIKAINNMSSSKTLATNISSNNISENINLNINNENDNANINNDQEENIGNKSSNDIIDFKDKINKNLKIKKILEKAIEVFNIGKSYSECLNYLKNQRVIFAEDAFDIIKNEYINDLNNNSIKNDYYKLLSPQQQTILTETATTEEIQNIDQNQKINIFQTPFISTINPLIYYILNEDKEKISQITYDDYKSFEMARFLRTNIKEIIRDRAGDYLCSGKPFNIKVLTHFINSFDFEQINILEAMRKLFMELPLSGEAQAIDRVVQIFGEKFHRENPKDLKNPDHCYYLSFALLQLNTDLHRDEVKKKMTLEEFILRLNEQTNNEKIDPEYLEMLYNKIQTDPLVVPGQKLSGMNKNKKELLKKERDKIMKATYDKLTNLNNNISNNYITDIDNDNIKHLIEFSWSHFFSIYCKILTETTNDINNNTYLSNIHSCIENILLIARTCGILQLNIAEEAYINSILNITNLNDNREITMKSLESIKSFINFIINSGQYVRSGWYNILQVISKLDYYLETDIEIIKEDIRTAVSNSNNSLNLNNKSMNRNIEKEINAAIQKKEIICKNIPDMVCEGIFSKTDQFDEETIINFVTNLCTISKQELTEYHTPRVFSLHKLVEVADFNIFRIQVEWVKIWKLISDHLVDVINKPIHETIWKEALESLRQTICKLLQKKDLSIYNFQMDFFKPFEIIFSKTSDFPTRGETIINYIYYIVGSFGSNIHSGWIVIFRILKEGFQRKDPKINEDIKNTLQKIYEENIIINNNANLEVFRGYIECLCYMYLNKNNKQFAFETILNLLSKIMINVDIQNQKNENENINNNLNINNIKQVMPLPNINKKYDYLKIFFYGFDDLIPINVVEHLNLLFEIISHNKKLIFNKDWHSFLYLYYSYFKPHLILLLLSKYINRFSLIDINENNLEENGKNNIYNDFKKFKDDNSMEIKIENARNYLIDSINNLIDEINSNDNEYKKMFKIKDDNNEQKRALIGFLNKIKDLYNKDEMTQTINKKLLELNNLEEHDYELAIDIFLEKFKYMLDKVAEKEKYDINYNYFYEDLVLVIHRFLIVNNNSDLLIKILNKLLSKGENKDNISDNTINIINKENISILNMISLSKNILSEDELHKLIKFSSYYSNFLLNFIQHYDSDIINEYKYISKIFSKFLEIDVSNNFERYKIVNSSSTIDFLIKLQGIQSHIKSKIKENEYNNLYNDAIMKTLIGIDKIYNKYKLSNEDTSMIFSLLQFELENTVPQFMLYFSNDELSELFDSLLDFVDSINPNLRKIAHKLLLDFKKLNLICFTSKQQENEEKEEEIKQDNTNIINEEN